MLHPCCSVPGTGSFAGEKIPAVRQNEFSAEPDPFQNDEIFRLLAVFCGETESTLLSRIPIQSLNRRRGVLRGRRRVSRAGVWAVSPHTMYQVHQLYPHQIAKANFFQYFRVPGYQEEALKKDEKTRDESITGL
jgi:hypothetical protein